MMLDDQPAPKVFISYSWDSHDHKEWVRTLATQLRQNRVDVYLDEWHLKLGGRSPEFMEKCIRESDRVLIICTPKYKSRSDDRTGGAGYEGHIISGEILSGKAHQKYIPILREGTWATSVPDALSGVSGITLTGESIDKDEYRKLMLELYNVAPSAPPLGLPPSYVLDALQVSPSGGFESQLPKPDTESPFNWERVRISISSNPASARQEGYTERMGDLKISVTGESPVGAQGPVTADITVAVLTNVTNSFIGNFLPDVVISGSVPAKFLKSETPQYNRISFEDVPIAIREGNINTWLTIRGIRANAVAVGVSAFPEKITATIEVNIGALRQNRTTIARETVTLAYVRPRTTFAVIPHPSDHTPRNAGSQAYPRPDMIRLFTARFAGSFDEAFTTWREEAGRRSVADCGVIFALNFSGLPSGYELFATVRDLSKIKLDWGPRAVAVLTDANGASSTRERIEPNSWDNGIAWNSEIPMIRVGASNKICWELMVPFAKGEPAMIDFGFLLSRRGDPKIATSEAFKVTPGLAPFYTTATAGQASGTLPIPRFTPEFVPFDVTLD